MRKNPERVAWAILLAAFFVCVGLAVGIPWGARTYLVSAQKSHDVSVERQWGTLRITPAGRGESIVIAETRNDIPERTTIATENAQGRLVMHAPQSDNSTVASVQLYEKTQVTLISSSSPRFSLSKLPHQTTLEVKTGNVRINVTDTDIRSTMAKVLTPQGIVSLAEGSYVIEVDDENTSITVRYGKAEVRPHPEEAAITLQESQRATVSREGKINGPRPAMRNLINNGDFQAKTEAGELLGWKIYTQQIDPQQPAGEINTVVNEGRRALRFHREGDNHAEVGITQEINQDLSDITTLKLHLAVRIISEDILGYGGCGTEGYECPVLILLEYQDTQGTVHERLWGFYIGQPSFEWPIYGWATAVPAQTWYTFDSNNLIDEMADPALLESVTIYGSGHTFDAMITEVELLAQE